MRKTLLLLLVMMAACNAPDEMPSTSGLNEESQIGSEIEPSRIAVKNDLDQLPHGFDVQGHRGARGLKPENTLPAFETALDLGVTTLELDLHFTANQKVVVWHDDKIEKEKCGLNPAFRNGNKEADSITKRGLEPMISQLNLEQVQAYRCDRNPDPRRFPEQENEPTDLAGDDYRIISLAELFDFVAKYSKSDEKDAWQRENASKVSFNIETKRQPDSPKSINDGFDGVNPGPFELEILNLVQQYGLDERVTIQSFDHRSLMAIRSVDEDVSLAALSSGVVSNPSAYAQQGVNIWSPRFQDLSLAMVSEAHNSGMLVIPWTVNDAGDMRDLIDMGVDGIISDRPDVLLDLEMP
jgi:glycerophosphoryl diester phosphodiesterase